METTKPCEFPQVKKVSFTPRVRATAKSKRRVRCDVLSIRIRGNLLFRSLGTHAHTPGETRQTSR